MKRSSGKRAKNSKVFRGGSTARGLGENTDNQEKEIQVLHTAHKVP